MNKLFKYLSVLIPVGVIIHVVYTCISTGDTIMSALKSLVVEYLLIAAFLSLVPWFTGALRIRMWTAFLGNPCGFLESLKIVLGTEIGAAVSPTMIGGGYIKLGMLIRRGFSTGRAASLTTLGTLEDTVFFIFALPVAFLITYGSNFSVLLTHKDKVFNSIGNILIFLTICAGLTLLFFLLKKKVIRKYEAVRQLCNEGTEKPSWWERFFFVKVPEKIKQIKEDFINVFQLIRMKGKFLLLVSILLTSVQWICRYSVITVLLACFDITVEPVKFFLFQWVVFTVMTFIPTPGGSGGAEATFYFVYKALIPVEFLGLVIIGWRFLTYYFQLGLGSFIFGLLNMRPVTKQVITES